MPSNEDPTSIEATTSDLLTRLENALATLPSDAQQPILEHLSAFPEWGDARNARAHEAPLVAYTDLLHAWHRKFVSLVPNEHLPSFSPLLSELIWHPLPASPPSNQAQKEDANDSQHASNDQLPEESLATTRRGAVDLRVSKLRDAKDYVQRWRDRYLRKHPSARTGQVLEAFLADDQALIGLGKKLGDVPEPKPLTIKRWLRDGAPKEMKAGGRPRKKKSDAS